MPSTKARNCAASKTPKKLSVGEETLALQLTAYKIAFQREVGLIPERKWRWDFYFRQCDLAIEIQGSTWSGGRHSRGAGQLNDYRKGNAAALIGVRCLYFTTEQVTSGEAINTILPIFRPQIPAKHIRNSPQQPQGAGDED